jgi:hypothetical protein
VALPEVGVTRRTSFVDRPPGGDWIYRVAVAANWLDDTTQGDVYLVGDAVAVTRVPRLSLGASPHFLLE